MRSSRGRRGVRPGRMAGVAVMVVAAAGMLTSCEGAGPGTGASPGPAGTTPSPAGTRPGPAGAAAAGPCVASRASAGSGGLRVPMLPRPGSMVVSYQLSGVAVASAASVWAVGTNYSTDPRAMHWNGSAWTEQVLTLVPGQPGNPPGTFQAVAAVSASDVWAVGGTAGKPLAERWDGSAWTVVPTPSPSPPVTSPFLQGIAAASARDIWAVGGTDQPLILHWDGRAWTRVPSPAPAGAVSGLYGVAAVSAVSAWAVGDTWPVGGTEAPLIEHWNGTAWTQVPSPAIPGGGTLVAVAASPSSAWAVGYWSSSSTAIIEHWNGTAWTWPAGFCAAPSGPGCYLPSTSSSSP